MATNALFSQYQPVCENVVCDDGFLVNYQTCECLTDADFSQQLNEKILQQRAPTKPTEPTNDSSTKPTKPEKPTDPTKP